MHYLLDTDIFTAFHYESVQKKEAAPITAHIATLLADDEVYISVVTVTEVMRGMLNLLQRMEKVGKDAQGLADFERAYYALQQFPLQSYDTEAHQFFSKFPPTIRRIGRPDCQIAAIALARNLIVVTGNTRHFAQIPGVVCEDWTRPHLE
jgi:tRNA(fMet)-specific endonuclease VapC